MLYLFLPNPQDLALLRLPGVLATLVNLEWDLMYLVRCPNPDETHGSRNRLPRALSVAKALELSQSLLAVFIPFS